MKIVVECPCCLNEGLHIDVSRGFEVICTGKRLSEYPFVAVCHICKRKVKYDIKREEK